MREKMIVLTIVISGVVLLSIVGFAYLCIRQENRTNKDHSDRESRLSDVISNFQERRGDNEMKNDIESNMILKHDDESIICGEGGCTAELSKCKTSAVYSDVPGMNNEEWYRNGRAGCDICGNKIYAHPLSEHYNCPKGTCDEHEGGYDVCLKCIENDRRKDNLKDIRCKYCCTMFTIIEDSKDDLKNDSVNDSENDSRHDGRNDGRNGGRNTSELCDLCVHFHEAMTATKEIQELFTTNDLKKGYERKPDKIREPILATCEGVVKPYVSKLIKSKAIPNEFTDDLKYIVLEFMFGDCVQIINEVFSLDSDIFKNKWSDIQKILNCLTQLSLGDKAKPERRRWHSGPKIGVVSVDITQLNIKLKECGYKLIIPSGQRSQDVSFISTYIKDNQHKWNDALICYMNILNKYRDNYRSKNDLILAEWSYMGHRFHAGGPPQQSRSMQYMLWKFAKNGPWFGVYIAQSFSIGL